MAKMKKKNQIFFPHPSYEKNKKKNSKYFTMFPSRHPILLGMYICTYIWIYYVNGFYNTHSWAYDIYIHTCIYIHMYMYMNTNLYMHAMFAHAYKICSNDYKPNNDLSIYDYT